MGDGERLIEEPTSSDLACVGPDDSLADVADSTAVAALEAESRVSEVMRGEERVR